MGTAKTDIGLRRVSWVRVTLNGTHGHAEAFGLSHRLPRIVPIPMATAAGLAANGVPLVVRRGENGSNGSNGNGT